MLDALAETLGLSTGQLKAIQSAVVVLIVVVLRRVVLRIIHSRIQDPEVWYRARKIATYTSTLLVLFFLLRIWLIQLENFATFLGLLSAGVAIVLSDVLKNLAGWAYLLTRRPFRAGDRVEIGDHAGDVIDIPVFRFSLLETGCRPTSRPAGSSTYPTVWYSPCPSPISRKVSASSGTRYRC